MEHVHGFEVWAVRGPAGHEVRYHIDYAEWHRKQTNIVCPPLFAITIQVSPVGGSAEDGSPPVGAPAEGEAGAAPAGARLEGPMEGGEYGANCRGLEHYSRFGYKSVRVPIPDGLPIADWNDPHSGWVKVPYRFNRAVMHPGEWPHLATRVARLPPGVQRVVIGINPFTEYAGRSEMAAPQHSEAFRKQLRLDKLRALIQGKGGERIDVRSLDAESKRLLAAILKRKRRVDMAAAPPAGSQ